MISDRDLKFLRKRRRFNKYGPIIGGALVVIFASLLGYLLVREAALINQLFPVLFFIAATLLIYCFYRCVSIERRHLKIIDKFNQQKKE